MKKTSCTKKEADVVVRIFVGELDRWIIARIIKNYDDYRRQRYDEYKKNQLYKKPAWFERQFPE